MYQNIYSIVSGYSLKVRIVLTGLAFLSFLIQNPSVLAADWLHFGYDSQYTSCNPAEDTIDINNISQLQRKWGIGCDDGYFSMISRSPAIYNGTLYTSGAGSKLTAYDAITGQELWQFGNGNYGWAPQPVVSADGIVFYMEDSIPTHLYAVDADTGNMLWEAPIGFDLAYNNTALVTVDEANNVVYIVQDPFARGGGKLFALNKQTGEITWFKSEATDNVDFEGDYVLLRKGKIFVEAQVEIEHWYQDRILCIDASSQNIEIVFDKPKGIELNDISQYSLCNNKLAVTFCNRDDVFESDSILVVYDVTSQAVLWQKDCSTAITGKIACNTTKNVIYVPTDPYLYALDAATGQEIWKYAGYGAIYNPSIANGIVYFISDTNMYAVNEDTGEKIFCYPLGYEADETTLVAICDGMVYFSGSGGTCDLFALALTYIDISVSPISHDFGIVNVESQSPPHSFTVSNNGTTDVVIDSITLTGSDASEFSITNNTCSGQTLVSGETSTVDIVFSPTSEGAKSANLSIQSNDVDNPAVNVLLSGVGSAISEGYLVTSDVWIKAVINTVEKGPIEAVWQKGGEDTTSRGDRVIWGHFYASPSDVTWGSQDNPDLFVKIWFDVSGRVDVNFFHVSVPDIEVYSASPYDGMPDEHGTTTMSRRYIRQYYENGQSNSDENYEDGNPPAGYSPTGNPFGYSTINDLRIGSIINTVEKGPIDAVWRLGGQDTTSRGDQVVWGHFYASPTDVTWGSQDNPDLFVKIWFDVSGRVDVNFFHVSVPEIEVYSDLPDEGTYDQHGTTIMDNRYISGMNIRAVWALQEHGGELGKVRFMV